MINTSRGWARSGLIELLHTMITTKSASTELCSSTHRNNTTGLRVVLQNRDSTQLTDNKGVGLFVHENKGWSTENVVQVQAAKVNGEPINVKCDMVQLPQSTCSQSPQVTVGFSCIVQSRTPTLRSREKQMLLARPTYASSEPHSELRYFLFNLSACLVAQASSCLVSARCKYRPVFCQCLTSAGSAERLLRRRGFRSLAAPATKL